MECPQPLHDSYAGGRGGHRYTPTFAAMAWHSMDPWFIRWITTIRGRIATRTLIVGAGTAVLSCRRSGGGRRGTGADRRITPPNILRRDMKGFIQLLGSCFGGCRPVLDPLVLVLERVTIGLECIRAAAASAPFCSSTHRHRAPSTSVSLMPYAAGHPGCAGVTAFDGGQLCLPMDHAFFRTPLCGHRPPPWTRAASRPSHSDREHGIPSAIRLHFIGMRIPLSGFLHEVGMDARQIAGKVARELGGRPPRTAIAITRWSC
jgi:hypothetical protein